MRVPHLGHLHLDALVALERLEVLLDGALPEVLLVGVERRDLAVPDLLVAHPLRVGRVLQTERGCRVVKRRAKNDTLFICSFSQQNAPKR